MERTKIKNEKNKLVQKDKINVYGYTPYEWQKDVHNLLYQNRKRFNIILCVKSKRQCGKSILIENLLLEKAINVKNSTVILLSPTLKQARKIFKDIVNAIEQTKIISKKNETLLELKLLNNSEIIFLSAEQKQNLRGYTCDLLCIDEAAFIEDEIFGIVLPFCNVKKAPCVCVSSPRFKTGKFFQWYMMGLDSKNSNMFSIDWNDYDTSEMLNSELLETYRKSLPKIQFLNEYLGLFGDLNSSVFGDIENLINDFPEMNKKYYMGIDWGTGAQQDYTSVTIFNSKKQMIFSEQWNDLDALQSIDRIKEIVKTYKPKKITVEYNSIGSVFYQLLKTKITEVPINKFVMTNERKNKLVRMLQVAIQQKDISFLNNQNLFQQMAVFETQLTKTGKTTFNAAKNYHDDLLISTMIAFESIDNNNNKYTLI